MWIERLAGISLLCLGAAGAYAQVRADGMPADDVWIPPVGTIQQDAAALRWSAAPASMPKGTQIAVLEGDPKSEGLFTLRISVPAGARLSPHWHPRDERVTILSGRVGVGFGNRFDEGRIRYFEAGSYYINPTPAMHFVDFPVASVVQITGHGPWEVHPAPSPRAPE